MLEYVLIEPVVSQYYIIYHAAAAAAAAFAASKVGFEDTCLTSVNRPAECHGS